jgi:3-deoxy-D-manno-octulosonic-acid transferase
VRDETGSGTPHGRGGGWAGAALGGVWTVVGSAAGIVTAAARGAHLVARRDDEARDAAERLGRAYPVLAPPPRAWLHASSMGEVGALVPLARALREARPDLSYVVTTSTTTGRRRATTEIGGPTCLAPLDAAGPVRRFVATVRPSLHVVVETEIWPTRLHALHRAGVPAALVSARLSPERWPRYRRVRALYARALGNLSLLSPASEADRDRFVALGAPRHVLGPIGNLKWDAAPDPPPPEMAAALARELGVSLARPWVVLGSVHPGESAPLLRSLATSLGDHTSWGALVAPRHPSRFDVVDEEIREAGFATHRLSRGPAPAEARVIVVDRMGVLARTYALARAAFVGGTLAPVGGHSPLEAAAAGVPLVAGPHDAHQTDLFAPLAEAGALASAASPEEAGRRLAELLADSDARERAAAGCRNLVARRRGHAERLAKRLAELAS